MINYWKKLNNYLRIGMIGSIAGCVFVALDHALFANMIWVISNPMMLIHNLKIKEHAQVVLWATYVCIALAGVIFHFFPIKIILDFLIPSLL
jgi:energy-converting hydrogenase Eha subunit C